MKLLISIAFCFSAVCCFSLEVGENYHGFTVTKSFKETDFSNRVTEVVHEQSGARVFHIQAEDPENFFAITFGTPSKSSKGLAHILEHSVVSGSEKFPISDLFFSMRRRTMASFMNAFTATDSTCYPAASTVEEDFYNLLDVYIDAVFHPLLTPSTIAREAARLEFSESYNPESPLLYKGVVYNEMKGALAQSQRRLLRTLDQQLFPDTAYRYLAGGDPEEIVTVTHEEVVRYHKEHYRADNCFFFFYGDIPIEKHLDFIAEHALEKMTKTTGAVPVFLQPRFEKEVYHELEYPVSTLDAEKEHTFIGMSWLTTSLLNSRELALLTLFDAIITSSEVCPLTSELLNSKLCKKVVGFVDQHKAEMPYTLWLEGCKTEDADSLQEIVQEVLQRLATEPIDSSVIERAMHQLELHDRLASQTDLFGLTLFQQTMWRVLYGGSIERLSCSSLLNEMRATLQQDLQTLVAKYFIENRHFVRVVMKPSKACFDREHERERKQLDEIQKNLTEADSDAIISLYNEINFSPKGDSTVLPMASLESVLNKEYGMQLEKQSQENAELFSHVAPTSRLTYMNVVFDIPRTAQEDLWLVKLFSVLCTEVACGDRSYIENKQYIQDYTGGIHALVAINEEMNATFHLSGLAVDSNADKLFQLLVCTATELQFSDVNHIKELVLKHYHKLQSTIELNSLTFAKNASLASSGYVNYVRDCFEGLRYFDKINELVLHLDEEIDALIVKLERLNQTILCNGRAHLVVTCGKEAYEEYEKKGFSGLTSLPIRVNEPWKNEFVLPEKKPFTYPISSPVSNIVMAFKTVPESAAIALASHLFVSKVLHPRIREQGGAYASGAVYDEFSGNFMFYSYRDPNVETTVQAFEEAILKIVGGDFDEEELFEAKVQLCKEFSIPVPVGSRALAAYKNWRVGNDKASQEAFLQDILHVTREDIQAVLREVLLPDFKTAVFVNFSGR